MITVCTEHFQQNIPQLKLPKVQIKNTSGFFSQFFFILVILDTSGFSKGYGFVRFGLEEEQKAALYEMNGYLGLGSKSLKICNAVPKPKTAITTGTTSTTTTTSAIQSGGYSSTNTTDYSQYYDPTTYWQGYGSQWPGYEQPAHGDYSAYYQQQAAAHVQQQHSAAPHHTASVGAGSGAGNPDGWYDQQQEDDDLALVEHKVTIDIDKMNRETIEMDRNLWDNLESSKWLPIELLEVY